MPSLTIPLDEVQSLRSISPKKEKEKVPEVEINYGNPPQVKTITINMKQVPDLWPHTYTEMDIELCGAEIWFSNPSRQESSATSSLWSWRFWWDHLPTAQYQAGQEHLSNTLVFIHILLSFLMYFITYFYPFISSFMYSKVS